jgi:small subunit ribosomal protein S7
VRWFKQAIKNRNEPDLRIRILKELIDAFNKKGEAFKKKESVHQLALLNRGFIKFLK